MNKYLVISALGKDRPGLVNQLSHAILDAGCNIQDSRMTVLGGEFALMLLVTGPWNAVGKLESQTKALEKKHLISQDDEKHWEVEIQKLTDAYIKRVDEALAEKDKEIKQV